MKKMNYSIIKTLTLGLSFFLMSWQLSAQMIPKDYFEPQAGGTPKSDFYTLISYDLGFVTEVDEIKFGSGVGYEGIKAKMFFPGKNIKGYTISMNYNKMIQQTYIYTSQLTTDDIGFSPILSNNFEFKLKSIGSKGWGYALFYHRRGYVLGGEDFGFNGLGFEISAGGYPDLNYEKGNWPVSIKTGYILQTESFKYEGPGGIFYSELALERIRKKQGVSLYASIYTRFQVDMYKFMEEGADELVDDPIFDFATSYIIPGFKIGFMF